MSYVHVHVHVVYMYLHLHFKGYLHVHTSDMYMYSGIGRLHAHTHVCRQKMNWYIHVYIISGRTKGNNDLLWNSLSIITLFKWLAVYTAHLLIIYLFCGVLFIGYMVNLRQFGTWHHACSRCTCTNVYFSMNNYMYIILSYA